MIYIEDILQELQIDDKSKYNLKKLHDVEFQGSFLKLTMVW